MNILPRAASCLLLGIGLSASPSVLFAGDLLQAGMYEIMSTMDIPNMPKAKPTRNTHCYSAADVKGVNARDVTATGKAFGQPDKRCSVNESSFNKNRSVWVTKCPEGTTRYDITYGGDTFESAITTTAPEGGSMILRLKGRRIGDCK